MIAALSMRSPLASLKERDRARNLTRHSCVIGASNGLLRQYYPKGRTNFTKISQEDLDTVADELNDRLRKTLGWAKPSHRMAQLIDGVATTP